MAKTVAISASAPNLDAAIDPAFGRCQYFILVDPAAQTYRTLPNPAADLAGGAGVKAAQYIVDMGATTVLTGMIGPNVERVFGSAGIQTITGLDGTIRDALGALDLQAARLREVEVYDEAKADTETNTDCDTETVAERSSATSISTSISTSTSNPGSVRSSSRPATTKSAAQRPEALSRLGGCRCPGCGWGGPQEPSVPCFKRRCPQCGSILEWKQ